MPGRQGIKIQDQRMQTAVDSMIENRNQLQLKDGEFELPAKQLPQSMDQFSQGLDHLEDELYHQAQNLLDQAGGARVPLAPAIAKVQEIISQPQIRDIAARAGVVNEMEKQIQIWGQQQSYSPLEMHNLVQSLNKELKGGINTTESISRNAVWGQVLYTLRQTLNDTMKGIQGPQYTSIRNQLSGILSIRDDVAKALRNQMSKQPGLIEQGFDAAYWLNAAHGAVTLNPAAIGHAVAIKGAEALTKYLRDPNRAVRKMFEDRARELHPPASMIAKAHLAVRDLRDQNYNAIRTGDIQGAQDLAPELARARANARSLNGGP
jgi:hypothetical protein